MMNNTNIKLTYALDKSGDLVYVDNVANGKSCNCICPNCKQPLEARQGKERVHHFAYENGKECSGAIESAIHLLAKEILESEKQLMFPNGESKSFLEVRKEENKSEENLRPDCLCIDEKGKEFWIEFKYSSPVTEEKVRKIVSRKINCLEIDLMECNLNRKDIKDRIINSYKYRNWVYSEDFLSDICKLNAEQSTRDNKIRRVLDENNQIVDLTNLEDFRKLNLINNSYYYNKREVSLAFELGIGHFFYENLFQNEDESQNRSIKNVSRTYKVRDKAELRSIIENASINEDLNHLDVTEVIDMSDLFRNTRFNGQIDLWDTSNVISMRNMFFKSSFNQPIEEWEIHNRVNIGRMFAFSKFNQDLSSWGVTTLNNLNEIFICSIIKEEFKPMK